MKKLLYLIILVQLSNFNCAHCQLFNDFYKHNFGLYTTYTIINTGSRSSDSLGNNSIGYWGGVNIDGSISSSKKAGFSCTIKERQISDLMYLLINLFSKEKKKSFKTTDYISDFGFLPNIRLGLNALATEKTIINVGLAHSYYISEIEFIRNHITVQQNNDWLCIGPNVYLDKILNNWLAIRFGTGPLFSYANGKKVKDNKPVFWDSNLELFTKFGLFTGIDMLLFSRMHEDNNTYAIKRYDFKLGYRF